jgi:hypothetical protein
MNTGRDVDYRITMASLAFEKLKELWRRRRKVELRKRLRLYNASVLLGSRPGSFGIP